MSLERISNTAVMVSQEYQIAATTGAARKLLTFPNFGGVYNQPSPYQRVIIEAVSQRIYFKFGDSTVTADATVTSSALPAGVFSVAAGAIMSFDINAATQNYVSVITASSSGTAIIKIGAVNL